MNEIAIYVEGGGETNQQKAELRVGFDGLFKRQKSAAREKRLGWRLVTSGSRNDAFRNFVHADPNALSGFYKERFHPNHLPVRLNLEEEPKNEVQSKLAKATSDTSKGEYAKIKHASKFLALIESSKVAERCPRFATLTNWLDEQIGRV